MTKKRILRQGRCPQQKLDKETEKRAPTAGKRVKDTPAPTVRNLTKCQANNPEPYAQDLVQTNAGHLFDTSVPMSTFAACLLDSVGHILLVPINPDSYNSSAPCSGGFPKL